MMHTCFKKKQLAMQNINNSCVHIFCSPVFVSSSGVGVTEPFGGGGEVGVFFLPYKNTEQMTNTVPMPNNLQRRKTQQKLLSTNCNCNTTKITIATHVK